MISKMWRHRLRLYVKCAKWSWQAKMSCTPSRVSRGIIVAQMGKVGSSTICRAIRDSRFPGDVYQVHILNSVELDEALRRVRGEPYMDMQEHLFLSRRLLGLRRSLPTPLKCITLTREPVQRAISFVSQSFRSVFRGREVGDIGVAGLCEAVARRLSSQSVHSDPGLWF